MLNLTPLNARRPLANHVPALLGGVVSRLAVGKLELQFHTLVGDEQVFVLHVVLDQVGQTCKRLARVGGEL